jgi:acetyl-CoA carboxylase carboxyltransferase component
MEDLLGAILDDEEPLEFQAHFAPEFLCATARLNGRSIGVIANRRGFLKTHSGPRVGGIVYAESARKVAYFVEYAERHRVPLLYVQDVSGFMVGVAAETEGIIRAGAEMVESMACATVPKVVLTVNHASGAGYYAMAGQGFDPNFTFSWPTARIGVMEGDSAIQAIYGPELQKLRESGASIPADLEARIEATRADYERWLDARYAAARGHCDAVIDPLDTREVLIQAFDLACWQRRTEHVPMVLLEPQDAARA